MPFTVEPSLQGTRKQLAQARPSNSSATSLYAIPSDNVATEVQCIVVANTTASPAAYRIFHDEDGATYTQATALFYDVTIAANTSVEISSSIYMLNASGNLAIRTDTGSALTFTAYGVETIIRAR